MMHSAYHTLHMYPPWKKIKLHVAEAELNRWFAFTCWNPLGVTLLDVSKTGCIHYYQYCKGLQKTWLSFFECSFQGQQLYSDTSKFTVLQQMLSAVSIIINWIALLSPALTISIWIAGFTDINLVELHFSLVGEGLYLIYPNKSHSQKSLVMYL